jgi:tRNA A37 threonylcarbamoyladenosine synthetase subunit TsaC/SUA5/YrdC
VDILNKDLVYFTQTDTTVGFLSQNANRLYEKKSRDKNKKFIKVCDSLQTLTTFARIPKKFKKMVRNSQKTTFVYPNNQAIRVIKDKEHLKFLSKIRWAYSSSANKSNEEFDLDFAIQNADIIIYNKYGFKDKESSKIYKLSKSRKKRLR